MTLTEMSNEFDILYNNIMSNQAPGLDEYEKSLFLTKAQNELILEYFSPKGNKFQEGFDGSERRQIDFSKLIKMDSVSAELNDPSGIIRLDPRSVFIKFPKDVLLIINETATVTRDSKNTLLMVIPISYAEYTRLMMKPYKRPSKYQVWRLLNEHDTASGGIENTQNYAELILGASDDELAGYKIRYIKRPSPIILIDFDDEYTDVSIDGVATATPCMLDPIIHHDIVQRAVELAKAAYTGDLSSQIQVGNISATNLGVVPSEGRRRE